MSTLNVSNITDGTTTVGTGYVVNGSAKAWVNFNGTGTIAARDSLNLSSLTDNGTGDYTVNFSNVFGSGDYTIVGTVNANNNTNYSRILGVINTPSVSNFDVRCCRSNNNALEDMAGVYITNSGDLA